MKYDIFFAGVGGQGILTIGEILSEAAVILGIPSNFYPSKGMAQRGGFVKAQLRLGRANVGPNIPPRGADMVVAMEISESLKALPLIKKNGAFYIFGDIWAPTAVALGKAPYPSIEQVKEQVSLASANLLYIDPADLPLYKDEPVRPNLFVLGIILQNKELQQMFKVDEIERIVQKQFKRDIESNLFALHAGFGHSLKETA